MRYMVHIEIPPGAGNRLDFEGGGPGAILEYLTDRFTPEAFYVSTFRRAVWMVIDLDEAKASELMLTISKKFGCYPMYTPVIPGPDVAKLAADGIEFAQRAP
jgi:hypothetical protein